MIARVRATIALAAFLAIVAASPAGSNTSVPIKNAYGANINEDFVALPSGNLAPTHVLVDGTGAPYSAANPLLTAPAIYPVAFTDHSGTVATANATIVTIVADATRKGGFIRALPTNTGTITVTLTNASGQTHVELLEPGDQFSMTVNGYVIQVAITVSGNTVGDGVSGVTYS